MTAKRATWSDVKTARGQRSGAAQRAYDDEAAIAEFRALVHRVRRQAGLTQAELADRMGTTQSAIARMEGGGTCPTLETLEKLAIATGAELVVGVAPKLSESAGIKKLVRDGHAVVRRAG